MGGQRSNTRPRCSLCGVHQELCVCAYFPSLKLGFDLIVVQNNHERNKPTNTGRLVAHAAKGSTMLRYAVRGEVFDASPLASAHQPVLLFPREGSRALRRGDLLSASTDEVIDEAADEATDRRTARKTLVLLDGTWGQCARMSRRIPELAAMQAVHLAPGPPSHWGVRTPSDPSRISSFEAFTRVVALVQGDALAAEMQAFFDRLAAAMLFMKGKLSSPEVPARWPIEGGVPVDER